MAKAIDRVTDILPQYTELLELFAKIPRSRDRLEASIRKVYVDLLNFSHNLLRIFRKSDGSKSVL